MNFLHLKYFLMVAEELNITRAAERLYISQQSLSSHISNMERELNVKLFTRSPKLALTYAGDQLVQTATQIIDLYSQYLSKVGDINRHYLGVLRVGISHTCGLALLPDILPLFTPQYPDVQVVLHEAAVPELTKLAEDSVIDFCVMHIPTDLTELSYELIMRERVFLIGHKDHPLLRGLDSPYDRPLHFTQLRQLEHERIVMLPSDWRLAKLQTARRQKGAVGLQQQQRERHLPHPLSGPACLLYHRGPAPHLPHGGGVQEKRLPLPRRPGVHRPDKGFLPQIQSGRKSLKKSQGQLAL